jgi:hypothetical protein
MNEGVCGWAPVPVLTGNRMKLGFSVFQDKNLVDVFSSPSARPPINSCRPIV